MPPEKPKISFAFNGADLNDPQVRQVFDMAEAIPFQPTMPHVAAPAQPAKGPANGEAQGGGRAMKNSNDNSAPVGNKPQQPALDGGHAGTTNPA